MAGPTRYSTPLHLAPSQPSDCTSATSGQSHWHQHDAAVAKLTTLSAVLLIISEREQTPGYVGSKGGEEEGKKRVAT